MKRRNASARSLVAAMAALTATGCVTTPTTLVVEVTSIDTTLDIRQFVVDVTGGDGIKHSRSVPSSPGLQPIKLPTNFAAVLPVAGRVDLTVKALDANGTELAQGASPGAIAVANTAVHIDVTLTRSSQSCKTAPNQKVDVLFLLDNSNNIEPMTTELRNKFNSFLAPIESLASTGIYPDLHIGIITSDFGAGATGAPGCSQSPGGQQGRLQGLGVKAPVNCKKVTGGVNFIQYAYGPNGTSTNNLPIGQTLLDTFACMASVGASGCGFEHVLEPVYHALTESLPENIGFLRDDALLVIVFHTNEDDASAPSSTDIFDKTKSQYGYEDSYSRQTRFGIVCCPSEMASCDTTQLTIPPYDDSHGVLARCQPAPNVPTGRGPGKLFDVSRYSDLFSLPKSAGGIKEDPCSVILIAIDAPDPAASPADGGPGPFQVILSNPGTQAGQEYQLCASLNESANPPCVPVLQHSCRNQAHPEFFGDPAVRLNAVVRAAPRHMIASICGPDSRLAPDYSAALSSAGQVIVRALGH